MRALSRALIAAALCTGAACYEAAAREMRTTADAGALGTPEATLALMRQIRSAAYEARADDFRTLAEPLLHEPEAVLAVLSVARERGLSSEDSLALTGFVDLALVSYAGPKRREVYGEHFDATPFVDAVVATATALPPECTRQLLARLVKTSLLRPEHADALCPLVGLDELRIDAAVCNTELVRRGGHCCNEFAEFLDSYDGDAYERGVRVEGWCALVEGDPERHTAAAMARIASDELSDLERTPMAERLAERIEQRKLFAALWPVAQHGASVDRRWMELLQRFASADCVELAKASFATESNASARCLALAVASHDVGFLRAVERDPALSVRSWTRYFLVARADDVGVACTAAGAILEDCENSPRASDLPLARDRALAALSTVAARAPARASPHALALLLAQIDRAQSNARAPDFYLEALGDLERRLAPPAAAPPDGPARAGD